MSLEVGAVIEGKVIGITKFGAFVDIGEGKSGMVHISEVASTFVTEIRDFIKEGQTVKVKVLSVSEEGKISLSIKKALPPVQNNRSKNYFRNSRSEVSRPANLDWGVSRNEPTNFEDMLSRFKQNSDEKMSGLKRQNESSRRGGYSRRNQYNKSDDY